MELKRFIVVLLASVVLAPNADAQHLSATFATQLPTEPGTWEPPVLSQHTCSIAVSPLEIKWRVPTGGVNSNTGVLVVLPGKQATFDCDRTFDVQDASWPDAKNVIVMNVFYRNDTFQPPYDFGKLQLTDVMRGLGTLLEQYPQLDTRRLYLYGASGGGLLALQVLQVSRNLWAEAYIHASPSYIGFYVMPPGEPVSTAVKRADEYSLVLPPKQGKTQLEDDRYEAERSLRSPRDNMALDLPSSEVGDYPLVYCMQGLADIDIPPSHHYDLRQAVENFMGFTVSPVTVTGGQRWSMRSWSFFTIDNGNHFYTGAHTSVNSFTKATNHYVPTALTTVRPTAPTLAVNYSLPWRLGWRFTINGPLKTAVVSTETQAGVGSDWALYE